MSDIEAVMFAQEENERLKQKINELNMDNKMLRQQLQDNSVKDKLEKLKKETQTQLTDLHNEINKQRKLVLEYEEAHNKSEALARQYKTENKNLRKTNEELESKTKALTVEDPGKLEEKTKEVKSLLAVVKTRDQEIDNLQCTIRDHDLVVAEKVDTIEKYSEVVKEYRGKVTDLSRTADLFKAKYEEAKEAKGKDIVITKEVPKEIIKEVIVEKTAEVPVEVYVDKIVEIEKEGGDSKKVEVLSQDLLKKSLEVDAFRKKLKEVGNYLNQLSETKA